MICPSAGVRVCYKDIQSGHARESRELERQGVLIPLQGAPVRFIVAPLGLLYDRPSPRADLSVVGIDPYDPLQIDKASRSRLSYGYLQINLRFDSCGR